ncbi:hypothetical protein FB45DRAFT_939576 [Roridomyces roridus]|uniref:ER transporter 6TM N-terminal domain-containing protein n=1 Tax=Roridomyces roridus TaxID=1738132 RepID=A0AAD7B7Q7_9AGAR|nr:hypothetical protein FB45DRAFT_939576 [Roridomyces roridus]
MTASSSSDTDEKAQHSAPQDSTMEGEKLVPAEIPPPKRTATTASKAPEAAGGLKKDVAEKAMAPGPFAWIKPAMKNPRTLKTLARCLLVTAATLILLVDKTTLNTMGQAGFFAAIVSVMLPPSLALSMFAFASFTLLMGMLLGWAWSNAAMAAALSVQSKSLLASRQAAAVKAAQAAGVSPTLYIQSLVFKGYFIDKRSAAVYGAMFFIGTYGMGAIRAHAPKLQLLGIFGTIVMDVVATFGPLFPTQQYTLAKLFLIPTAYYIAIALAALAVIFPESLNHIWLRTLDQAYFGPVTAILSLQNAALAEKPSDHVKWAGVAEKVVSARIAIGGGLAALAAQIGLIDLEISVGRLGPGDLKRLAPEIRGLGFRANGLLAFTRAVLQSNIDDEAAAEHLADLNNGGSVSSTHVDSRFARRRARVVERETRHGHDLDTLVPILAEASAPLRTAAASALAALRAWFLGCNAGRWTGLFRIGGAAAKEGAKKRSEALREAQEKLEGALQEFRAVERARLVKPFERFFDPATGRLLAPHRESEREAETFAVRSLFICFMFADTLDVFAVRLLRVLALIVDLDGRREGVRVWFPTGFGKIWRKATSRTPGVADSQPVGMGFVEDPTKFENEGAGGSLDEEVEDGEEEKTQRPRNPDALPPKTSLGRFLVALGGSLRWFKSPEGIFALRHAVVSLALWVPSVVPRTAGFYYANKGLWALIMAQTGLATFAGDQLFGLVIRLSGTIVGLLNGMVAWYIAAPGKHNGNPYALVVVATVFTAPFMFGRIASPPVYVMFWTMVAVTTVFVVGYSWLDTHFTLAVNSGVGIEIGWKRALLVIIGFVAGAIVMMFPRPTSARTLVRRTLAATLLELGNTFGTEVELFLAEEARSRSGHYEKEDVDWVDRVLCGGAVSPKERRIRRVAKRILAIFERLQALAPSLKTAQWEPTVQGVWPSDKYELLHAKATQFITSLSLLGGAFSKLDPKWCNILVHRTPFLNPNLLSDLFSTIDILSHALSAGRPIPASLPCLRDRLVYHDAFIRALEPNNGPPASFDIPIRQDSDSELADSEHVSEFVAGKVEGASIGFQELSLDVLMDESLPTHSTAVIALQNIFAIIDDIRVIVRDLCGETTFRGFDALQHEFLGREEAALGTFARQ